MKSFVVAALLVVSVAAQNMDMMTMNRERSLFRQSRPLVEDLLLKEKLSSLLGMDMDLDTTTTYPTWTKNQVNILSLDEMVSTPLFREYYNIPLFRQFWEQYPTIFQKYVKSVLFQQFWTVPAFITYFRNPVLFYKYIVPQVQLIAQQEQTTLNFGGLYNQYNNKYNVPTTTGQMFGGMYKKNIDMDMWMGQDWSAIPMSRKMNTQYYPTMDVNTVNYKFLLDSMYKQLNMDKFNKIQETLTDVKVLPTGQIKEQTIGMIVDPITGEQKMTVGDFKTVDEKIMPVTMDFPVEQKYETIYQTEMMKEALLKKFFLNKIYGNRQFLNQDNIMDNLNMDKMINTPFTNTYGQEEQIESLYPRMNINNINKMNNNQWAMSPIVSRLYGLQGLNKVNQFNFNKMNKINSFPYGRFNKINEIDMINNMDQDKLNFNLIGGEEKLINGAYETEQKMIPTPFMSQEHQSLYNIINAQVPKTFQTEKYLQRIPLTKQTIQGFNNELRMKQFPEEIKA